MGNACANPVRTRSVAYASFVVVLVSVRLWLGQLRGAGNSEIHTLLEMTATLLAFFVGAKALVCYYTQRSAFFLLLGSGFLGAGLLDGYHVMVTSALCVDCTPSSLSALIPWTGVISRIFLSLLICGSLRMCRTETYEPRDDRIRASSVYLLVGVATVASFVFFWWVPLPPAYRPDVAIHRPADMLTGVIFTVAFFGFLRRGNWKSEVFHHWFLLSLMAAALGELIFMSFSGQVFDPLHVAAHILKILSYLFAVMGLFQNMIAIFRHEAQSVCDLKSANERFAAELEERQRAESALQQSRDELEARVIARTADLAEQGGLAALASEIAILLACGDTIRPALQRSAELMNHYLEAAFVRIWTVNTGDNVLELEASAGRDPRPGCADARIPLAHCRIGRIAAEAKQHLTNPLLEQIWESNPECAERQGLSGFAAYPLMIEEQVVGVVAAFAPHRFTKAAYQTLGSLAGTISQFIQRKRMETALQDSEEKVRLLLDSTAEAIYGIDLEGCCTFANQACLRMLGYESPQAVLGKNMHHLMHHSHVDGSPYAVTECRISRAFQKGEGSHADDEVLWRADGTSFPAEYWSYPVRKASAVVGAVVTFVDISQRKQAEEDHRKLVSLVETSDDMR